MPTNGSWTGRDPRLRTLRSVTLFVLLALLSFSVIVGQENLGVVGVLLGAILLDLGFEIGVRLPSTMGFGGRKDYAYEEEYPTDSVLDETQEVSS